MPDVRLRGLDPRTDVECLFVAHCNAAEQALFSPCEPVGSLESFDAWLRDRVDDFYHEFRVVEVDGAFAGFVYSYGYSASDQRCNLCSYVVPELRDTGVAGLAAATFLDRLFACWPLRKVYLYVYDYNEASLRADLDAGFEQEGLLRDYRYLDGGWWDCHVLAMTRERFYERLGRFSLLGLPTRRARTADEEAR